MNNAFAKGIRRLTSTVHDYKQGILGQGSLTLDAKGTQKTVHDLSLFSAVFTFNVPKEQWIGQLNGTEEVLDSSVNATSSVGELNITSGVGAGADYVLSSRIHPRYQANRGLLWSSSIYLPDFTNDSLVQFGLFNLGEDAAMFEKKPDGKLYASVHNDGVEVASEEITLPAGLDLAAGNLYDIQMLWRGVSGVFFFIGDPDTGLIKHVHTLSFLNTLTAGPYLTNPAISASYRCKNITQEAKLISSCVDISVEGGVRPRLNPKTASVIEKSVSGVDTPVIAIFVPDLLGGKLNTRDLTITQVRGDATKRGVFKVWKTRDLTAFTAPTFAAVPDSDSVQQDTVATALDIAKCILVDEFRVEANAGESITLTIPDLVEFETVHGDYLALTYNGTTAVVDGIIKWGEKI